MKNTDVLIVGAGPTGLTLACQLVRYGIDFILIEKNTGVTTHSKAIGVQARTLEIYEQLGVAEQAIDLGQIAGKIQIVSGGKVRGGVDLSAEPRAVTLRRLGCLPKRCHSLAELFRVVHAFRARLPEICHLPQTRDV